MIKNIDPIDDKKLKSLLEHHDYAEAKNLINSFLDQKLSPEEKGRIYSQVVSTYLTMVNDVNKSYLEELKSTTAALKNLRQSEKKVDESLRMAEIKQNLSGSDDDDL